MKKGIYVFLKFLIKIALHVYYKKIIVQGRENIPYNQPVILVANHQNALIDPLVVAAHISIRPYFLTRAAVFKNPIAAYLLDLVQMLPVYRILDGFSTIPQNQRTFQKTNQVLQQNGSILVFSEGNHSTVRNIRPLSKGFTRMAYGALAACPEINPVIVAIGIQYSAHKKSGSLVKISIGKPIPVDPDPAQAVKLTRQVETALKSMVVDLSNTNYEETLQRLLSNQVDVCSKEDVEQFLIDNQVGTKVKPAGYLINKMMKLFHFPLYWIWLFGIAPKMEDEVFTSTWKFLIGGILAPIYYCLILLCCFIPGYGPWAISFLLMAWITVYWNENSQE
ncbi:MAG: 1-acyl-sn-glycerol-3-phosphate acyltransferase [Bacteroidetes bacterium]|nr:1-acyl-sn-glycerol-3-phosphate acyltransferase [Bacteroidota bacterium]